MTGLRRAAACAAALLVAALAPAPAGAGTERWPSPWASTFPDRVVLVGRGPAGADSAAGHFECRIRDPWNNPVPFVTVIFELEAGSDFRIAADQSDPRLRVVCSHQTVYTITGADGVAPFTIVGAGRQPWPAPGAVNRFAVSVDGQPFTHVACIALDLDGRYGVNLADVAYWGADLFGGLSPARADFDGDGRVGFLDLSAWARAYLAGGSAQSAAEYCP